LIQGNTDRNTARIILKIWENFVGLDATWHLMEKILLEIGAKLVAEKLRIAIIAADERQEFTCPVCLELPRQEPVPCCPNGHIICSICLDYLPKNKRLCPTCNKKLAGQTCSPSIENFESQGSRKCRFRQECLTSKSSLEEIIQHEEECLGRPIKCNTCKEEISIKKFGSHNNQCFTGIFMTETFWFRFSKKGSIKEWNETNRVGYINDIAWKPCIYRCHNKDFILKLYRSNAKKKYYMWVTLAGKESECSKYEATFSLKDPIGNIKIINTFNVLPMNKLFQLDKVKATGDYCTILDRQMEKIMYIEEKGKGTENEWIRLDVTFNIVKK
jgi:hypothetical protein